jgi:hypothetical protein
MLRHLTPNEYLQYRRKKPMSLNKVETTSVRVTPNDLQAGDLVRIAGSQTHWIICMVTKVLGKQDLCLTNLTTGIAIPKSQPKFIELLPENTVVTIQKDRICL